MYPARGTQVKKKGGMISAHLGGEASTSVQSREGIFFSEKKRAIYFPHTRTAGWAGRAQYPPLWLQSFRLPLNLGGDLRERASH